MRDVTLVLRGGGEYKPEHVFRLAGQIEKCMPGAGITCLSDVDVPCRRMPLQHGWPGWWSKMEIFSTPGDTLYFDLDTTIVGSLEDVAAVDQLTIMRDVYRPDGLQSSMMFIPEAEKPEIWRSFIEKPDFWMRKYKRGGDQAFLERFWLRRALRWQDVLPRQVVSYKVHCRRGVPDGARVVIHHGRPRPWEVY